MQESFGFVSTPVADLHLRLLNHFGPVGELPRRKPIGQLVKSIISSSTRDAVSLAAYHRIGKRWHGAGQLACASPAEVEEVIFDVTYADKKARYLPDALARIWRDRRSFDLDFLGEWPMPAAFGWLEQLAGVGRKVAAATLNASTLNRPVFIVDRHVHRVLGRIGCIGTRDAARASELVTNSAPNWGGDAFFELFVWMKRLGQTICRHDVADCHLCPLSQLCDHAKSHGRPALQSLETTIPGEPKWLRGAVQLRATRRT